MKRIVLVALLPPIVSSLFIAGVCSSVNAEPAGGCVEPVPVRSYTQDKLTYRMAIDLTDCSWWSGQPIELNASLNRVSPEGDGGGAGSLAWCAASPLSPESQDGSAGADDAGIRPGACAIEVSVDHPPFDGAHYKGHITYPWADGRRTRWLNVVCQPSTDCIDLPVDPSVASPGDHRVG